MDKAKWLIWRVQAQNAGEVQAAIQRYEQRFGVRPNTARVSQAAPDTFVEGLQALCSVERSGYVFNPCEVFLGVTGDGDGGA